MMNIFSPTSTSAAGSPVGILIGNALYLNSKISKITHFTLYQIFNLNTIAKRVFLLNFFGIFPFFSFFSHLPAKALQITVQIR